jgi:hypothetical protein
VHRSRFHAVAILPRQSSSRSRRRQNSVAAPPVEDGGVPMLDAVRERRPPYSPDDAVLEIAGLLKSYHVTRAESDRWGGDWVGEVFRKHGITVAPSARPKSELYTEVLPLLNATHCSLLDHPRLVSQLCGLDRRTSRGGRDSIDHAPGAHDDLANATAGALLLVGTRPPMRVDPRALERSRWPARHAY